MMAGLSRPHLAVQRFNQPSADTQWREISCNMENSSCIIEKLLENKRLSTSPACVWAQLKWVLQQLSNIFGPLKAVWLDYRNPFLHLNITFESKFSLKPKANLYLCINLTPMKSAISTNTESILFSYTCVTSENIAIYKYTTGLDPEVVCDVRLLIEQLSSARGELKRLKTGRTSRRRAMVFPVKRL